MPHWIPRLGDLHQLVLGLFTLVLSAHMAALVTAVDHTGLLANTLFTFKDHACAGERLHLRCPYGTTIRVQWAQYGRQVGSHQMCGTFDMLEPEAEMSTKSDHMEDTQCLAQTSLEVVLQKCQDQRTCKLVASAAEFGTDPCPGTSKYLEVAYKCRPNEFRSRITCERDDLLLRCKKSQRLAIYSATFGRSRRGNLECPAGDRGGFDQECSASCSLDVVMKKCHGKRRCSVTASTETFGDPCDPGTKKYLSVIYACVPRRILKEIKNNNGEAYPNTFCDRNRKKDETGSAVPETETPSDAPTRRGGRRRPSPPTTTMMMTTTTTKATTTTLATTTSTTTRRPTRRPTKVVKGEAGGGRGDPSSSSSVKYDVVTGVTGKPGAVAPENQSEQGVPEAETTVCVTPEGGTSAVREDYVGFVTDWIYTVSFIEDNLEKFILYVILGLFLGLILLLITIIIRMAQTRRRKKRTARMHISEPVPNSSAHTEDLELLSDSDRTDGIEILSINHNNRPPPFRTDTGNRSMNSGYYG